MANDLSSWVKKGTYGELLVILRLLEHDVQATYTLKDSGNDLIAAKGYSIKTIQVKTTSKKRWGHLPGRNKKYHILALVKLRGEGMHVSLDQSAVYLLDRDHADGKKSISESTLGGYKLEDRVEELFGT